MGIHTKTLLQQSALKMRKLREQLNYTRKEMASYVGISPGAYWKNEAGETFPGLGTLSRMSKDHDLSMDWFIFDRGPMYYKEKEKAEELAKALEEKQVELAKEKEERRQEREKHRAELEQVGPKVERRPAGNAAGLEIKPGLRDLFEHMERIPLLYHEIMAQFQRFKKDNREFVEISMEVEKDR